MNVFLRILFFSQSEFFFVHYIMQQAFLSFLIRRVYGFVAIKQLYE